MTSTLTNIIFFFIFFHQALYLTYFLQLKEYRFDRLISGLKQLGFKIFFQMFNLRVWYRPRLTLRSLLTLLFILLPFFCFGPISLVLSLMLVFPTNLVLSFLFFVPKTIIIKKAKHKLSKSKGIIIGITGSFGKTFTKELVHWVLSKSYKVAKTRHNHNTLIGIAQDILSWPADFDYAVIEMAAYKRGEIAQICQLTKPQIGIITGIGDQHLDLFGSLANIKKAKYELIDSLPKDGHRLVADMDFSQKETQKLKIKKNRLSFTYQGTDFSVPVIGSLVVSNIVAAIKLCQHLGLSLSQISTSLSKLPTHLIYPKLIKTKLFSVIDDTHNSSFESFSNLINYAQVWSDQTKILITNGIIELGENEIKDYQKLSPQLIIFDHIITANKLFYQTTKNKNKTVLVNNSDQMLKAIINLQSSHSPLVIFAKGRLYPQLNQFLHINE